MFSKFVFCVQRDSKQEPNLVQCMPFCFSFVGNLLRAEQTSILLVHALRGLCETHALRSDRGAQNVQTTDMQMPENVKRVPQPSTPCNISGLFS
jgi:hypothetical protein